MTFDEQVQGVQRSIEAVALSFTEPDDDWTPVAIVVGPDPAIVGLVGLDKTFYPSFLRAVVEAKRPRFLAIVLSTWTVELTGPEAERRLVEVERDGVAAQPDRSEAVLLDCSDGTSNEVWEAAIIRSPDAPPRLGPWERLPYHMEGRLATLAAGAMA